MRVRARFAKLFAPTLPPETTPRSDDCPPLNCSSSNAKSTYELRSRLTGWVGRPALGTNVAATAGMTATPSMVPIRSSATTIRDLTATPYPTAAPQEGSRFGVRSRITEPMAAAVSDAARIPIFASFWRIGSSSNARPATNSDTVKPMPARAPTPTIPRHVASAGNVADPEACRDPRRAHNPDELADDEANDDAVGDPRRRTRSTPRST